MRQLRLLFVGAVVGLGIAACDSASESSDGGRPTGNFISLFEPAPRVLNPGVDECPTPAIPFPFDGLFAGFTTPTLNIPGGDTNPLVAAANRTDGFSTTAEIFTDLIGFVDMATAPQGILVIDTSTGAPLVPGQDFTFSDFFATDERMRCVGGQFAGPEASFGQPISAVRSRILIQPLKPLKPATQYLVVVTDALRDTDGRPAIPSEQFRIARSATPVPEQDLSRIGLTQQQQATLEQLRSQLIRPAVEGVLAAPLGLTEDDLVLVWTFTTQSIAEPLEAIAGNAEARAAPDAAAPLAIFAQPSGLTTADIAPGVPNLADIFIGAVDLPYFLEAPGDGRPDSVVRSGFWRADPAQPNLGTQEDPTLFLGQVPCGAFAAGAMGFGPSVSTTRCFPVPVENSVERAPLLATVPNQAPKPESGWPVVIFQHGITVNRSAMLAIAPALSAAGFVVAAIDLPLHGIPPEDCAASDNPQCPAQQQLRSANALTGARERTFDVDLFPADGVIDGSGDNFINLNNLLTARDNNRQGIADLLHLRALLPRLDLDMDGAADIDAGRIFFVGHSLGGIVGTTFVALDEQVQAATLANPGGGVGKLLDASAAFGPVIGGGLAAAGVVEGTDTFETFLRFAQHLVDPGDPVNFAGRLAAAPERPIHFIEVVDDLVVPNSAPRNPAAGEPGNDPTLHRVTVEGRLSGSTPLISALGLDVVEVDVAGGTPQQSRSGAEARAAVRFLQGNHGSVLTPGGPPPADPALRGEITTEMQRQIVTFLGSGGQLLPILGGTP